MVAASLWVMTFSDLEPITDTEPSGPSVDLVPEDKVEGFETLFVREQAAMLRLAFLLVGSVPAAEEAVQDAFATVYEKWSRLDRPGAFLRTCVVNQCKSRNRRAAVAMRKRHLLAESAVVDDRNAELADALARLPQKRRTVVVLRHYLQMNTREIADAMGISEGTVKSSLHRGLEQLKEHLR